MAYAKPHSLSQMQRDLRNYATQKTYALVRDVMQSFTIAGETLDEGAACLGIVLLRMAAALAVGPKRPMRKENFLRCCDELYDAALREKQREEEEEEGNS